MTHTQRRQLFAVQLGLALGAVTLGSVFEVVAHPLICDASGKPIGGETELRRLSNVTAP
jgi:hypothetical protein